MNGDQPCFGEIDFPDGRSSVVEEGVDGKRLLGRAKFAVIPNDASAKEIVKLLELSWGVKRPGALFSVAGGVMNLKLHTVLAQVLTRGLAEAASIADGLITTAGVDAGVMRLIGVGLNKANSTAACIGIVPWRVLDETLREDLKGDSSQPITVEPGHDSITLEPHHTHFLLVNNPLGENLPGHSGRESARGRRGGEMGRDGVGRCKAVRRGGVGWG